MTLVAGFGRAVFGQAEWGRGIDQHVGTDQSIQFESDGVGSSSWLVKQGAVIKFHADGSGVCTWGIKEPAIIRFEADGRATCYFVSGGGFVRIACMTTGVTDDSEAFASEFGLFDAPSSY